MNDLEARLERLDAYHQIRQLAVRYAAAICTRDKWALGRLYVDDVRVGGGRIGRAALREVYFGESLMRLDRSVLQVGTHVISIDPERPAVARGTVYSLGQLQLDDRWIRQAICYTDRYARRDSEWFFVTRDHQLFYGKKAGADSVHVRAECALRDHPTLGRWLRQQPSGRLVLDRAKIATEARLDGKYLLSTSDPDLSAEDVALGYKNLLEAERGFRDLKSTLEPRPVFHRVEPRIRAHVLLCWLALLLIRVAERRTGLTWRRIALELGRVHAVTLTGTAGSVTQTTPLSETAQGILRDCQVTPPPAVTTLNPT